MSHSSISTKLRSHKKVVDQYLPENLSNCPKIIKMQSMNGARPVFWVLSTSQKADEWASYQ